MSVTREAVESALSQIIDPDLGRDIVTLGFVKELDITDNHVALELELTTPACPVRDQFRDQAKELISGIEGVQSVQVRLSSQIGRAHV